jgi:hypothetical protein
MCAVILLLGNSAQLVDAVVWMDLIQNDTRYMSCAVPRVNYFLYFKNNQDLKILGFFVKLYPRISSLIATPDPRAMFIILIITLNLG